MQFELNLEYDVEITDIPSQLIVIKLPTAITMINEIGNFVPEIVDSSAVGLIYTPQQSAVDKIEDIDINRLTMRRSSQKYKLSPYNLKETQTIAKNLGIKIQGKNKGPLVEEIKEMIEKIKNGDD